MLRRRPTLKSFAPLQSYLAGLAELDDPEIFGLLERHAEEASYPRGDFFTRVGDTHDRLGFVIEGLFRVYYTGTDGTHYIRNFCHEGRPIGSYATILSDRPAHVDIEALEDSTVLEISYAIIHAELDRSRAWERIARRIAEQHYISRERREEVLLTLDASGRFAEFEEELGHIAHRLTQADIASYIGVRPETLSRLMKRFRRG